MFRRLESGLPADPRFPADLPALGFFINDKAQICRVRNPSKFFNYRVTNDDRTNEVHREAFHIAVRKEVRSRLKALGIGRLYLPQLVSKRPKAPHIPIIATPARTLRNRKRVIVVVNDEFQDLGILAWRMLAREVGIEGGSCIALIKELIERSQGNGASSANGTSNGDAPTNGHSSSGKASGSDSAAVPGIIVLNPGQLLYSYALNETMARSTWLARNVASTAHPSIQVKDDNYVAGHESSERHTAAVFESVIANSRFVHPDAEIYIIAMQRRGDLILEYLDANWTVWASRVKAIALTEPTHSASKIMNEGLKMFLRDRGRAWSLSPAPAGAPLASPVTVSSNGTETLSEPVTGQGHTQARPVPQGHIDWCENIQPRSRSDTVDRPPTSLTEQYRGEAPNTSASVSHASDAPDPTSTTTVTQPTYSAGDLVWAECVFPTVMRAVLDWFEDVAREPDLYKNPAIALSELWQGAEQSLDEVEGSDAVQPEHSTAAADGIAGPEAGTAAALEREYAGGEADAQAEHGGFVVKEEHRHGPMVEVAGASLPASLVDAAGLGDEAED